MEGHMTDERRLQRLIAITMAATLAAMVGSCAAKTSQKVAAPAKNSESTTTPTEARPPNAAAHDEFRALVTQIQQLEGATMSAATADAMCTKPVPKTPRCTDVCKLGTSICGNADKICKIAAGIPDDAWAQQTCTESRAACGRSTKRCCGCVGQESKARFDSR